jgi:hypothetical protein
MWSQLTLKQHKTRASHCEKETACHRYGTIRNRSLYQVVVVIIEVYCMAYYEPFSRVRSAFLQ